MSGREFVAFVKFVSVDQRRVAPPARSEIGPYPAIAADRAGRALPAESALPVFPRRRTLCPAMQLHAILRSGEVPGLPASALPAVTAEVVASFLPIYATAFQPPWLGYLAEENGVVVGTCAFKTPPQSGAVEIAYFTFPGHEGRGVAKRMARALLALAHAADPQLTVFAQTLPTGNASTRVLTKLGFVHTRDVQHPEDGHLWEWEFRGAAGEA